MGDRWRLFVAVAIGDDLRAPLAACVEEWREHPDLGGLRWTDPASWHLTLAFLGATEPTAVPGLIDALGNVVRKHEPIRLETGALGAFPSAGRARVAWYGVEDPAATLRRLADDVRRAVGSDRAAPFQAHVTLARARAAPVDLRDWVRRDAPTGQLRISEVLLMRSHIGAGPARYETVAAVPIGAAVHA